MIWGDVEPISTWIHILEDCKERVILPSTKDNACFSGWIHMNCFQVAVLKRASGWTENSREGISKGSGTYTVGSVLALPSSHCFHSDAAFALKMLASTASCGKNHNFCPRFIALYFRNTIHCLLYLRNTKHCLLYLRTWPKISGFYHFETQTLSQWLYSKLQQNSEGVEDLDFSLDVFRNLFFFDF